MDDESQALGQSLPPPRDDEPATLRRDIADELADHLDCATKRELHQSPDDNTARQRALLRFGNPAKIARRLYLDAMKEAIMKDRIQLVAVGFVSLIAIAACALAVISMRQSAVMNAQMLQQITAMNEQAEAAAALEWGSLTVEVVDEKGEQVEGVKVTIDGHPINSSQKTQITRSTESDGAITFNPIRPGYYRLEMNESEGVQRRDSITLMPGEDRVERIIWPAEYYSGRVRFETIWPEGIAESKWPDGVLLQLAFRPVQVYDIRKDETWQTLPKHCIIAPDGSVRWTGIYSYQSMGSSFVGVDDQKHESVDWSSGSFVLDSIQHLVRVEGQANLPLDARQSHRVHKTVKVDTIFTAKPNQLNTWTIPLPVELFEPDEPAQAAATPSEDEELSSDWSRLRIQVRHGDEDGPPAGVRQLHIGGAMFNAERSYLRRETDEEGDLELGPIRPGQYHVSVPLTLGASLTFPRVTAFPGQVSDATLVIPHEVALKRIEPRLALPESLHRDDMGYICTLGWTRSNDQNVVAPSLQLYFRGDGSLGYVGRDPSGNTHTRSGAMHSSARHDEMWLSRALEEPPNEAWKSQVLYAGDWELVRVRAFVRTAPNDSRPKENQEAPDHEVASLFLPVHEARFARLFHADPDNPEPWRIELPENVTQVIEKELLANPPSPTVERVPETALPPLPKGMEWEHLDAIDARVPKPNGWVVKTEVYEETNTVGFKITPDGPANGKHRAEMQVWLSRSMQERIKKTPSQAAVDHMVNIMKWPHPTPRRASKYLIYDGQDTSSTNSWIDSEKGLETTKRRFLLRLVADDSTDRFYLLVFSAPLDKWDELTAVRQAMLDDIQLDGGSVGLGELLREGE